MAEHFVVVAAPGKWNTVCYLLVFLDTWKNDNMPWLMLWQKTTRMNTTLEMWCNTVVSWHWFVFETCLLCILLSIILRTVVGSMRHRCFVRCTAISSLVFSLLWCLHFFFRLRTPFALHLRESEGGCSRDPERYLRIKLLGYRETSAKEGPIG